MTLNGQQFARQQRRFGTRWLGLGLLGFSLVVATISAEAQQRRPDFEPTAYAIQGAKIVSAPGVTIESATVVVRNGVIEAVGPADEVEVPYDAEVIDGEGLVVYPGLIDLYTTVGVPDEAPRSQTGLSRPIPLKDFAQASTPPDNRNGLTPEFQAAGVLNLKAEDVENRRKLGFTGMLSAPGGAIATGQSALVALNGRNRREAVIDSPIALHIALRSPRGRAFGDDFDLNGCGDEHCFGVQVIGAQDLFDVHAHEHDHNHAEATADAGPPDSGGYPGALMGIIAHLRQAMLDAEYHQLAHAFHGEHGGPRPPFDPALEALYQARQKDLPVWWEANSQDEIHRVLDLAEEFGTTVVIVGGREAYKVKDRLKETGASVVLRVSFPKAPEVAKEEDFRKKPLKKQGTPLRAQQQQKADWEERVACARELAEAGIPFALSSDGLSRLETFHDQVKMLVEAGLPVEAAIKALTADASWIAGVDKQLGTIEPGKLGHLVAFSDDYGSKDFKTRFVLVDGLKFELNKPKTEEQKKEDEDKEPKEDKDEPKEDKDKSKEVDDKEPKEDKDEPKEDKEDKDEPKEDKEDKDEPKEDKDEPKEDKEDKDEPKEDKDEPKEDKDEPKEDKDEPKEVDSKPFVDVATEFDEDRKPTIKTGGDVLIKGATILTVTEGTIPNGSILVRDGKIEAIGQDVEAPDGITIIDASGMVAMPGMIDTHSHMAIDGGVNEGSLSIVSEVRVLDVVTGDDLTIYRAAAGGVTGARLLHGSANTIGGQDAVIKLHYGKPARELILQGGPQGIKFALGENVTRKRSSDPNRFPFSRMGVEATLIRAFEEARDYQARRAAHEEAQASGETVPPFRRDLRLEALADILDGEILIHSHCYRADEILMLLQTAESYGIKVQSLQHVLEGYKIAAEIAEHGASSSTFSDWWAYKVEAFDAIPQNAAILTEAGGNVCIKSDSGEEVRHLYLEAAKMVRYGGVSEEEALAMVTINPARELGLDDRIGSIEVGKDADIAIFDAHPLDGFARCQFTLVNGEVVFQLHKDEDSAELLKPRPGEHLAKPSASPEALARTVEIPVNPEGVYALTGATIHPVSGDPIKAGTLVIVDGKIAAIGGDDTTVPEGATTIALDGLDVWPGLIDSGNVVGLDEIGSISATQDARELAPHQPELRTSVAINPDSTLIPVNRADGVTSTLVQPTGGDIAGQSCLIDMNGWVAPELVLIDELALHVNIPRSRGGSGDEALQQRLDDIRDHFRKAKDYDRIDSEARERGDLPPSPDPRLSALAPYARGEKPVIFSADDRDSILQALELAEELGLKAIISGGADAWKVANALKEANVPVIVQGTQRLPGRIDPYDAAYANPARLHAAGVTFAISSNGSATDGRNLPFEAALAAAHGLPEDEALKAVTLSPAEILGASETIGSLEVGKRANLVITAGHVLQPTTVIKHLFIGGQPIPPENRQTDLAARYRSRLEAVKAGSAPLGLQRDPGRITQTIDEAEPARPRAGGEED
ncbi:hypothetical protein BH23PLA1_BH23PLA1_04790 [soil metagenome]